MLELKDIRAAAEKIDGSIARTPFLHSQTLSKIADAELFLKFEVLQYTASFKERGALNKLLSLTETERRGGVIAVSAGNHAQGVAYHAQRLGIPAVIVMPESTPNVKIARTREFGAEIILAGGSLAEAAQRIPSLVDARGLTLVHPYDDDHVIAGQGTVGLEMLESGIDLDTIVVAVGGGGLISGIGCAAKALSPRTEIIGVQSERYRAMTDNFKQMPPSPQGALPTVAEGIAVSDLGRLTREYVQRYVDDMLIVREADIEDSVALLLQVEKTLCEGAGAAGLATVLANRDRFRGKRIGLVLCGGNIDTRMLVAILQRQLIRSGRLLRFRLSVPDSAGQLARICRIVADQGGNINTIDHNRTFDASDARSAQVDMELEVQDPEAGQRIEDALTKDGIVIERL